MITLSKSDYEIILNHCLGQLPNEACGLLAGTVDSNKMISKIYLLSNIDESSEHFSMDPKEQFGAIKDIRANDLVLLGNFHSHPNTPARPSEEDIRLAFDPNKSYLILSLAENEHPVLQSFQIVNQEVFIEELFIGGE